MLDSGFVLIEGHPQEQNTTALAAAMVSCVGCPSGSEPHAKPRPPAAKKFGQLLLYNHEVDPFNGIPFLVYPYGNQWDKEDWIQQGIRYFRNGCMHP